MKIAVFDGNSIFNRAFYGIRLLTNKDGLYTNAIFGFLNIYFKFLEEIKPDGVAIAFDMRAPTFRHKHFEGYKAKRTGMPEELAVQFPILKELLTHMNVAVLEKEGYEADDIIGTISRICTEQKLECNIITGDKDSLQLINEHTVVHLITTRMGQTTTKKMDEAAFVEEYNFPPCSLVDLKAIMGDASDNIPGVKGIGQKGGQKLIETYKTLDEVYKNLENSSETKGTKKKLLDDKENAYLSHFLAMINKNVPMEIEISDFLIKEYNLEKLVPMLNMLEFKNFIAKLGEGAEKVQPKEPQMQAFQSGEILAGKKQVYILPFDGGFAYTINGENFVLHTLDKNYREVLGSILCEQMEIITHDAKSLYLFMDKEGMPPINAGFDTFLAGYVLDPSKSGYRVAELINEYLNESYSFDKKAENTEEYALKCVPHLANLHDALKEKIKETECETLYYKVELPLARVLADMEIKGFKVDGEMLVEIGKKLDIKIEELKGQIFSLAGEEFNINSPKQLGVVLYEKLNLPTIKKNKTGYSTDVDVLNKLKKYHPIAMFLVEYRQYAKLKSTYIDGLLAVIDPQTGRIHSSFNQTITQTGRLSSTEPNLQNIPVRMEIGREIRKVFVADDGFTLLDADYSQIELRVLAHIAGDEMMINAFKNDVDIHTLTASQVFHTPIDKVDSQMRSKAKAVNFGIVYGIGEFSLSEDLGITRKEAKEYIEEYLHTYKGVSDYMGKIVESAKADGYVKTILNRRRYIPEISSKNHNIREFAKRCAMNTPIQGSAADIIKIAMVKVAEALKEQGLKSYILLQVHDELIINAANDELVAVRKILKENMENAYSLDVSMEISMGEGRDWYSAKE